MSYVDKKASSISVTPGSIITSTNLQDAIGELETEITDLYAAIGAADPHDGSFDKIQLDTDAGLTSSVPGEIVWNDTDGTVEFKLKDGDVTLQVGQETIVRVVNKSGSDIPNGSVVYLSGSQGQRLTIGLADANLITAHNTIGVVTSDPEIANNDEGYVTIRGLVRGIDVGSLSEGDIVYLSETAGDFTGTKPTAPNHKVQIGYVVKEGNNGSLFVSVNKGTDLTELDDVVLTNLADKDLLVYDSATSTFKNTKTLGAVVASEFTLTDTAWDDLRFPVQGINPAGAADSATRSTVTGFLEFLADSDNTVGGVAQMPHSWKEGTTIYPHIHIRFPNANAGNTRWRFDYDIANVNENFVNAAGTYTSGTAVTVASPLSSTKHVIAPLGSLTMTGKTLSCIIIWRITRLGVGDVLDTYASTVSLLEFDIHYEIDKLGSDNEFTNN